MVAMVAVVGTGGASDPAGPGGWRIWWSTWPSARHVGSASVWTRMEELGAGHVNAITQPGLRPERWRPKSLAALVRLEGQRLSLRSRVSRPKVFAVERGVVRNELRESSGRPS